MIISCHVFRSFSSPWHTQYIEFTRFSSYFLVILSSTLVLSYACYIYNYRECFLPQFQKL
jgi:hypothetical protein